MKFTKTILTAVLLASLVAGTLSARATDKDKKPQPYPLDKCVVSDEKLGSMGEPVNMIIGINLVKLCCKGCAKQVSDDPAKVLAKVNEGWKAKHDKDHAGHDHAGGG